MDKLVKVYRRDGGEVWVLVHVEIQNQPEAIFAERMYTYNYRLFDHYHCEIASFAVLGDERPTWRPQRYERSLWGCRTQFDFPIAKLTDYREHLDILESTSNPFAVVVMAHLKAKETHGDQEQRLKWKLALVRQLYERGYTKKEILRLFTFIDWLLRLPEAAEQLFWEEVQSYEEEEKMTYVTSVERIGIEKGIEQGIQIGFQKGRYEGLQEGIQKGIQKGRFEGLQEGVRKGLRQAISLGLEMKFGEDGLRLMPEIERIDDLDTLQAIYNALRTAQSLGEIRRLCGSDE